MKYDQAFIEAIKDLVYARSLVDNFHGINCQEGCLHISNLRQAEANLDSFGGEKKEVKPQDETLQEEEVERRSMFPGKGW